MTDTAQQETTLYQRLGEDSGIKVVVDDLYVRIMADETLAPFFDDINMADQKRHMVYFLTAATGGPNKYAGRDMAAAHARHYITDAHFDRVIQHAAGALTSAGVESETIAEVANALDPLRTQVVTA